MTIRLRVAHFVLFFLALSAGAENAILPDGFDLERVVSGLRLPTSIVFAPNGEAVFIAEKGGRVLVWDGESERLQLFSDLSPVVNQHGDRGLAGIAVHPEFPSEPFVYLAFTWDPPSLPGAPGEPDGPDGKGRRVSRLIRVAADPASGYRTMLPESEKVLLGGAATLETFDPGSDDLTSICQTGGAPADDCLPSESHAHGINSVRFGPDGMLWLTHGEASNGLIFDPRAMRAQDLRSLAGKVIRIDPDTGLGLPDNPFFDGNVEHNESRIWSYGVRNPFRFTFHPESGELFAGDVGWNSWEEIDVGGGTNFGWPCYEGVDPQPAFRTHLLTADQCAELYDEGAATPPLHQYRRSPSGGALILGEFYTGSSYPAEFRGALFFADFNDQWIRVLQRDASGNWNARPFGWNLGSVVQIARGPDEQLWIVTILDGSIRRLVYNGDNQPPVVQLDATPRSGAPPLEVSFSSAGTNDPEGDPLELEWSFGDGARSTDPNPVHRYTSPGIFTVTLTAADPRGARATAEDEIVVGASTPRVEILSPRTGSTFRLGETIRLTGSGIDAEEGPLHDEQLVWEGHLHHASHVHPDWFRGSGSELELELDDHGDETWIELILTGTDSTGTTGTDRASIFPAKGTIVLDTSPRGLELVYSSESLAAPAVVSPPAGSRRTISAPPIQDHRSFAYWSHGAERSMTVEVDGTLQSYLAYYVNREPTAVIDLRIGADGWELTCTGDRSSDPEGDQLTYRWSFGDGAESSEPNPTHRYTVSGSHLVTLTVTDELGSSDVVSRTVYVGTTTRRRAARPQ